MISDPQQQVLALRSYDYAKEQTANYTLAAGIKDICRSDTLLTSPFQSIRIGLLNHKSTLIPAPLFQKDQLHTYLGNVLDFPNTDRLLTDQLLASEIHNVYSVNSEILQELEGFFPKAHFFHGQSPVLQGFYKLASLQTGPQVYINVHEKQVQILAFKGKELLFSNTFPFEASTDFIYYVLLIYDQLQLKPELVPLTIAGMIVKDSEIYHLLYRYIRLLNLVQAPDYYRFPESLRQEGVLHHYFDLCSLKLCE